MQAFRQFFVEFHITLDAAATKVGRIFFVVGSNIFNQCICTCQSQRSDSEESHRGVEMVMPLQLFIELSDS